MSRILRISCSILMQTMTIFPDGDPEVLLEGFGIEDSHSVINSLRFGLDGWLYGGQAAL